MIKKGIILAGGAGTRLYPLTIPISKQLMPVYDKPMIYYPLSVLMLSDIRDILVISTQDDQAGFQKLLRDGSQWGIKIQYAIQARPEGLPQAFTIAEDFLAGEGCALILGDNIFYGSGLSGLLKKASSLRTGATIFGYPVHDPQRYGVVSINESGKIIDIEEKPLHPKSNYAVVGLYYFDNKVVELSKTLKPSKRGETEITDLLNIYFRKNQLKVELLGRGFAWLDTGTHESILEASNFVQTIQKRQGFMICCPEEIAWRKGYISTESLLHTAKALSKNEYGAYLKKLLSK